MELNTCHSLWANYDIALNHIFFTSGFRNYFTQKYSLCPSGLTIGSCSNDDDTEITSFAVSVKKYGYESLSNNGFEYSDLSDYEINYFYDDKLTREQEEYMVEYVFPEHVRHQEEYGLHWIQIGKDSTLLQVFYL